MKALFLDRDGVINVDYGYIYQIEKFKFNSGIFDLLKLFINKEYKLFVITNQSGIARGYYSIDDFNKLTKYMLKVLKKEGIAIERVLYCSALPNADSKCRKPNTGMIDDILKEYPINLQNSWLIGDKQSDIDLAINAKVGRSIAINIDNPKGSTFNFKSIQECVEFFKNNSKLI